MAAAAAAAATRHSTRSGSTKRPRSASPATPSGPNARLPTPNSSKPHATPLTSHFPKATHTDSPSKAKKLKLQAMYSDASPFPDYARPTPAEAQEVFALLAQTHRAESGAPVRAPPPPPPTAASTSTSTSNAAQTCGRTPNVLEALIGTILSQNTSAQNSARAQRGLNGAFGRNGFAAIERAPREAVAEAIRSGGLANKKAGAIQGVLRAVKAKHGAYSLQHLAGAGAEGEGSGSGGGEGKGKGRMADEEIMQELMSYDGVGPKTASCVLLFCLGRDSFAVDTHVFRLSKVLGWVPPTANRVTAQAHLDLRIPDELKYGLHVLMIQHGRVCKGCKKAASASHEPCVLKEYLRNRKGEKQADIDVKLEHVKDEEEKE